MNFSKRVAGLGTGGGSSACRGDSACTSAVGGVFIAASAGRLP
jgi:hypothetical protein